ncbi:MAG: trigger factor [Thermovirgaceae bacterium]|nr:trigger factor [Synergistales bacterium]MDI9391940.1 trigger factor [Synergistota bacterium]MDY0179018.1 trigger factor [Synergistaceae bacterium]MDD3133574.1 trigger factor [Synergistales bacterium]MDD3829356.1 trigger factor [Synergistales bacterium]
MRSEIVSQEKNITSIKVVIGEKDFQSRVERTLEDMRSKANIKGFRKGHVPRKVLQMHLGMKTIMTEALEKMIPDVIDNVVKEYELDLISEPSVDVDNLVEGEPVVMTFVFETRPEVILPELDTLQVTRKNVAVTSDMVEEAITSLIDNAAERGPVEVRQSREGDILEVEYGVVVLAEGDEGDPLESPRQKTMVELVKGSLPEELFASLVGRMPGENVDVDVRTPSEEGSGERILRYSIDVISVAEKKLPEMNGAFFEKVVGEADLDEDGFREKVREKLHENLLAESLRLAEKEALSSLVENSRVEIPESLVERQKGKILEDMAERVSKENGKTLDEFIAERGLDRERLESGATSDAEATVRRSLVMEALADREMIQIENADVDREIEEMALSFKVNSDRMKEFFLKNSDGLADLVHRIRMKKTVSRLMEKVTVREEDPEGPQDEPSEGETEKEGS